MMSINELPLSSQVLAVVSVIPDSSASKNGIPGGDLIISLNGREATRVDHIHRFLSEWPAGKPVKVTVIRGQERL